MIDDNGVDVDEDLAFFRVRSGQRVHARRMVVAARPVDDQEDVPVLNLFMARVVARCGASTWIVDAHLHGYVSEFADDDLCAGCVRATPEAQRDELFDHPVPG